LPFAIGNETRKKNPHRWAVVWHNEAKNPSLSN
jgi:hypothetical protein